MYLELLSRLRRRGASFSAWARDQMQEGLKDDGLAWRECPDCGGLTRK